MFATARIHNCECTGAGSDNAGYAMKLETINTLEQYLELKKALRNPSSSFRIRQIQEEESGLFIPKRYQKGSNQKKLQTSPAENRGSLLSLSNLSTRCPSSQHKGFPLTERQQHSLSLNMFLQTMGVKKVLVLFGLTLFIVLWFCILL